MFINEIAQFVLDSMEKDCESEWVCGKKRHLEKNCKLF